MKNPCLAQAAQPIPVTSEPPCSWFLNSDTLWLLQVARFKWSAKTHVHWMVHIYFFDLNGDLDMFLITR
jgi:hypothetical protein